MATGSGNECGWQLEMKKNEKRTAKIELLNCLFHLHKNATFPEENSMLIMTEVYAKCNERWICAKYDKGDRKYAYNAQPGLPDWINHDTNDPEMQHLVKMMNYPGNFVKKCKFMEEKNVLYCLAVQSPPTSSDGQSSSNLLFYFGYTAKTMKQRWMQHCAEANKIKSEIKACDSSADCFKSQRKPMLCCFCLLLAYSQENYKTAVVVVQNFKSEKVLKKMESAVIKKLKLTSKPWALNIREEKYKFKNNDKVAKSELDEARKWLKNPEKRVFYAGKAKSDMPQAEADSAAQSDEEDDKTYYDDGCCEAVFNGYWDEDNEEEDT